MVQCAAADVARSLQNSEDTKRFADFSFFFFFALPLTSVEKAKSIRNSLHLVDCDYCSWRCRVPDSSWFTPRMQSWIIKARRSLDPSHVRKRVQDTPFSIFVCACVISTFKKRESFAINPRWPKLFARRNWNKSDFSHFISLWLSFVSSKGCH